MARRIEIVHFAPQDRSYGQPRQRSRRTIDASQTVWIEAERPSGAWTEYDPALNEATEGGSVPCCRTKIANDILFIEGTKAELEERLLPRDCPKARQMGSALTVTSGSYPKFHLDPRRLATAEGWHLHRQPGDSTSRYTISLRGEPEPRFVLQRLEKHPELHREDRWVDITATLTGVQASGQLRPKP